ncbi:MAG TPA: AraC family transcriptional regulator [Mobilitalea sp.]|nr:AraC family transcriptional regulator [Mobilitalea sp.]
MDVLLYNPDIMKEFKILEFAGIDFPFWVDKGKHTAPFFSHTHNFIELEIIVSGSADHIVEGKNYHIEKGDVLVILPGYVHELQNVDELEIYNFKFDLDKLTLLDTDIEKLSGFQSLFLFQPMNKYAHEYNSHMVLSEDKLNHAKLLCDLILDEWNERKEGYKWVIKSYFLALITYLSRNFSPDTASCSDKVHEIAKSVSFIHENLQNKITLLQLSSMACLSERQYSRVFKEIYGLSPIDYVINCRLTLACKMMKNTQLSLQQICIACGFGDKVSFSRLFKTHYQITPGEYRKRLL